MFGALAMRFLVRVSPINHPERRSGRPASTAIKSCRSNTGRNPTPTSRPTEVPRDTRKSTGAKGKPRLHGAFVDRGSRPHFRNAVEGCADSACAPRLLHALGQGPTSCCLALSEVGRCRRVVPVEGPGRTLPGCARPAQRPELRGGVQKLATPSGPTLSLSPLGLRRRSRASPQLTCSTTPQASGSPALVGSI